MTSTLLKLKQIFTVQSFFCGISILLCAHAAIDDEVDRAIDNEEEVLDGSEGEHPPWVVGEHSQAPAKVGSLNYIGLKQSPKKWGTEEPGS